MQEAKDHVAKHHLAMTMQVVMVNELTYMYRYVASAVRCALGYYVGDREQIRTTIWHAANVSLLASIH